MKENVPADEAITQMEHPLPPHIQEVLGKLVGVAQRGLLTLSIGIGLGVLAELMEEQVTEVVGPKGRHDLDRQAVRHGHRFRGPGLLRAGLSRRVWSDQAATGAVCGISNSTGLFPPSARWRRRRR
jgi:hypothetical protein